MCYTYSADESSPGGFKELSAKKGMCFVAVLINFEG